MRCSSRVQTAQAHAEASPPAGLGDRSLPAALLRPWISPAALAGGTAIPQDGGSGITRGEQVRLRRRRRSG